jgi:peroxiredoxin Q/BCP
MSDLAVGQLAPDFTLPEDSGKPVKLSSLRGKWVVLTFYAEDDTPACTKQVCSFRDAWPSFRKAGAVVLGVSPDSPARHTVWRAREKLPFALLSDEGNKVARGYGAYGEKLMYGRKVEGVIRTTVIIDPSGRIADLQRRIRTAGHGERVAQALQAAMDRAARERASDPAELA